MASNHSIQFLVVAAGSFLGGLALGLLISPGSGPDNIKVIKKKSAEAADWMDKKSLGARQEAEARITDIKKNVKDSVKRSIPDLYDATKDIHLDDDDLLAKRG